MSLLPSPRSVLCLLLLGAFAGGFAGPAAADPSPALSPPALSANDPQIEACLAEARQAAPEAGGRDGAAHDRRIVLATQCICGHAAPLCRGGMVQDPRLRQRVLDDK